jgi:hypothetical protein
MTHAVILTAPPAWGKTRNAESLRGEYRCTEVVDDWRPGQPIVRGALHLTNVPPSEIGLQRAVVICRGWPEKDRR